VALAGFAAAAFVFGPGETRGGDMHAPPNVILVLADDVGYGDLACHGHPDLRTPNLDRLHARSVRLTDFHVDPTCSPTRAALLTGRYSSRTGVWHTIMGRSFLRRDEVTLADVFAASGYRTGMFGKWHLGGNYPFRPHDRGFEQAVYHGNGGIGTVSDYWGNDKHDDVYFRNGRPDRFAGFSADVFFDQAMKFMARRDERPFFVYLATNVAHRPWNVPREHVEPYLERGVDELLAHGYGTITRLDENVGRLIAFLDECGLTDNTIVVFLTDNGSANAAFNAGMRGAKGSVYDGGHRVPCFVRWPKGGIDGGRDVEPITAHVDLLPTLVELCNLREPPGLKRDGRSLVPLLRGQTDGWPSRTLFVHSQRIEHPERWRNSAVMTDRWRLINGRELYDMKADPGQQSDMAAKYPQVVQLFRQRYLAWWNNISTRFDEYCPIVIGSDEQRVIWLTSDDWHEVDGELAWNQTHVRRGVRGNGFWAVEIARDGLYALTLRRWPKEVDRPITAALPPEPDDPGISIAPEPESAYAPVRGGRAIEATSARLRIGPIDLTKPIPDEAAAVAFEVELKAGPTRLAAWLVDAQGDARGAYYVYVEGPLR
jgi:arylsulfatase B